MAENPPPSEGARSTLAGQDERPAAGPGVDLQQPGVSLTVEQEIERQLAKMPETTFQCRGDREGKTAQPRERRLSLTGPRPVHFTQ